MHVTVNENMEALKTKREREKKEK